MRLERNGDPIAKSPRQACAEDAKQPGASRREGQEHGRGLHAQRVVFQYARGQDREPQRQQSIRQRCQDRQRKRPEHERRLVAVAQLANAPHGRQRRRQIVDGSAHTSTSYETPSSSSVAVNRCACRSNMVR